ncbi:MAG: aminopeptidase [Aequorivita sp.]|nr:MAG: aminopeptidase [Aequorivita sp.]
MKCTLLRPMVILLFISVLCITVSAQEAKKPRARDLGIPFTGAPGAYNSITDVPGLLVGYKTLIVGEGALEPGKGPVRTGVTVILPKGKSEKSYAAAWFNLNGDGEMTGLPYVEDYGTNSGAIGITNTNSVGVVRDAIGEWNYNNFTNKELIDFSFGLPVVAETWDGLLNDINGLHVKKEDVFKALDSASSGSIAEGNVGGGTGMALYGFKGGSGTASRIVTINNKVYTLGVFIQANFGGMNELTIAGVPVGKELGGPKPIIHNPKRKDGSAIVIVATDAPLSPNQLKHLAKRVTHGIARTGTISHDSSGEIFMAVSTATPEYNEDYTVEKWEVIPKWLLNPLYQATVEATEEAIINTLVAAEEMKGINDNIFYPIPHAKLQEVLRKYNRLVESNK